MEEMNRQLNKKEYLEYIEQWKIDNKELIESGKCRKVFLECLPIIKKNITWKKSIDYNVYFIYQTIQGIITIKEYKLSKILFIYNNKQYWQNTSEFSRGNFGRFLNIISSEFKIKIGTTFKDEKRDLIITDKENRTRYKSDKSKSNDKWYKYTCNVCGWTEGWAEESNLLRGQKCSCCDGKTVVEGINDIPTTAPWMVKYFQRGYEEAKKYAKKSNKRFYPICPDCEKVKDKSIVISDIYNNHSIKCNCSDGKSYISKFMFNVLTELEENKQIEKFKTEIQYDWCIYFNPFKKKDTYGVYDFILENMKLIIETDGEFHRIDNKMNGQRKEESIWIDTIKDKLAQENGYTIIRVSDENDIKQNILESNLNKLFDLSNIDWDKCNEFALSNRIKEACLLKKNNPNLTCNDIGKLMRLTSTTILKYLKKGSKIWDWISYDAKEELKRNYFNIGEKAKIKNIKNIMIFKDNIFLGLFKSSIDLQNKSENLFKMRLAKENTTAVARGARRQYKGYTFKYVINLTTEEYIEYDIENKLQILNNQDKEEILQPM